MEEELLNPKMKVLVCDPIHRVGIEKLEQAGFEVHVKPSISGEELRNSVSNYDVLIVRSRTKVKKEIIETGKRLKVIGRVGVGLGNIGEKVAIIAKAFGMKILITKRTPPAPALLKELEAEFIPLQELLREATLSLFMFPILGKLII